jgi:hypothetical protein
LQKPRILTQALGWRKCAYYSFKPIQGSITIISIPPTVGPPSHLDHHNIVTMPTAQEKATAGSVGAVVATICHGGEIGLTFFIKTACQWKLTFLKLLLVDFSEHPNTTMTSCLNITYIQ